MVNILSNKEIIEHLVRGVKTKCKFSTLVISVKDQNFSQYFFRALGYSGYHLKMKKTRLFQVFKFFYFLMPELMDSPLNFIFIKIIYQWQKVRHISNAVSVETILNLKYIGINVTKCTLAIFTKGFKDHNRPWVGFLDHLHPKL